MGSPGKSAAFVIEPIIRDWLDQGPARELYQRAEAVGSGELICRLLMD